MRILLFIKTPPPVTGATLINKWVNESLLLHEHFDIRSICISYAKSVSDLGKLKVRKFFIIINTFNKLLFELIFYRPGFVYFQISPLGSAFIRDLLYVLLIKAFSVKIVFHLHGKGIKEEIELKWKKRLYRFVFHDEFVISLSTLLTSDIEDIYKNKIYVVNNGIPDLDQQCQKDFSKSNNNILKILFLSNLIISKGILEYLDSLAILKKKKIPFEGVIVGAEADLSKEKLIVEITKRNLVNEVNYLGKKFDEEKYLILNQSDVFVFPTKMKWECFPAVILEAMQGMLPVISTRHTAIPDIIDDGVTGYLVDIDSPSQIAEKLEILIKNPDLRISMGLAGRKKFEDKYTLEQFEKNMKYVFSDVLTKLNNDKNDE